MSKLSPRWPAVLSKKEALEYVGGDGNWTALLENFPSTLTPFRKTANRQWWYRPQIDTAIRQAQLEGNLITTTDDA